MACNKALAARWALGRRIVECEQAGTNRASYGEELIERLGGDLTARFGRGFSKQNLLQMRKFYLFWPEILQTPSGELRLPWSAYVRLMSVKTSAARLFYETEALRGGWSVRQLDRQVNSQFYERTVLSRNQTKMVIELKTGKFGAADAGQMHLYLNYAREHWTKPDENPPVGLILCAAKGAAEARYALDSLPNKIVAAEYQMLLPDERLLVERLERWTQKSPQGA
ncbi:PDDEXK nuclease domain-containing protein [Duganella rhizosphaerae]|uniref:PDDEXK nuclease domain-containing protein n=1 Tax=Duganella rhizosphaerae TaxID=2885763 RepID=UPI00403F03A8